ncbi:protein disulfide isomerase-like 1-4 [Tasmannia lanceolata]|uniref:protein disulfide isomerase-like 1-4 n=1 Tax=Tasmannia lanceolata TaxID=3420 RepID=UPI004063FD16
MAKMEIRILLILSITTLLLIHAFSSTTPPKESSPKDSDLEDLSFLEEDDELPPSQPSIPDPDHLTDDEDFENFDDFEGSESDHGDSYSAPQIDEKDVVVLKEGNFSEFLEKNRFVMVEFYATWCGHCQALAPEYAAAATELKGEAVLAKVDATEENDLAQKYEVQGFPTVFFFIDGIHKPYPGQRNKDAIVTWIKKKTGPGIHNITSTEEAERILNVESKLVLGFLDSLVGPDSQELASASKLEDDVNFYQTSSPDVAKLFHIDPKAKRPALVLLKKEAEKLSHFDGQFTKSAIADFVFANKLPLVTTFTRESAPLIFESSIKKQLLLFATSHDAKKVLPTFQEAAKLFKGKLIFVSVEMDNEDVGKPVSDYFGVTGDGPSVLAYTGNDDPKKYMLDGELTLDSVKAFGEGFVEDKLKPFYKSDPIPKSNDGDVKIIVGNNFDEIVLDESKDVLLEIYAPWCGHCQALEPTYNKLAKHLRGIDSLVIAKMDGTTNEHPRAKSDGFPTLLFFPAGNKSFDPITVDTDRTVVAFYKFIKQNAAIPFKLQRPASAAKTEDESPNDSSKDDVKDEL